MDNISILIESHMGIVKQVAKSLKPRNPNQYDEWLQLGRIALWKLAKRHNIERGQFSTAAYTYVKYEIIGHLRHNEKPKYKASRLSENYYEVINDPVSYYIPSYNLTVNERQVIEFWFMGFTVKDISLKIDRTVEWTSKRFHRACSKIRKYNE